MVLVVDVGTLVVVVAAGMVVADDSIASSPTMDAAGTLGRVAASFGVTRRNAPNIPPASRAMNTVRPTPLGMRCTRASQPACDHLR